ncbi:proline--tRNA ligase [Candidatus Woesearchaeota archaeon]|nr:proline--tRNA ligase [Candidatus Woesearchaeota archaeon]
MGQEKDGLTVKKSEDFSEWYTQLMIKAELADIRYNVKGLPVYMHWSTKSMKKMYRIMENILENEGHEPILFPAMIPEQNFKLESEHVKGFIPEVFWVTEHGNNEKLEEKLALRPTSETAFYQMYALWIRSYRDLPFKRYQSGTVWRYETKATRPFFRTREVHWIETHNAFANEKDADNQVIKDMKTTEEFLVNKLAIPFIFFQRPQWDKFSGAVNSFAADALMPSGKVLQLPSTHFLGQKFSKAFNVKFMDKDKKEKYVYITCYGPAISRIYGALIALHGDDKGLILPFDIAPYHIVVVPILFDKTKTKVLKKADEILRRLNDYDIFMDKREEYTPGYKFNEWEMKGVPIRIEVGPNDLENKTFTIFRRDINKKYAIKEKDLEKEILKIKKEFTSNLIKKTEVEFKNNIKEAKNFEEMRNIIENEKIARVCFCSLDKEGENCATKIEKELGAFVRGKKVGKIEKPFRNCVICNKKSKEVVYVAKSY